MYYQGLPSLIVPSKMMICGTMTLPYLFRIHLFGVGAKVEDSIISGLVTRQGGKAINPSRGLQNVSITLPIAVSNILAAVCSSYNNSVGNDGNSGQVCDFTGKSLTVTIDNGGGIWLAICK